MLVLLQLDSRDRGIGKTQVLRPGQNAFRQGVQGRAIGFYTGGHVTSIITRILRRRAGSRAGSPRHRGLRHSRLCTDEACRGGGLVRCRGAIAQTETGRGGGGLRQQRRRRIRTRTTRSKRWYRRARARTGRRAARRCGHGAVGLAGGRGCGVSGQHRRAERVRQGRIARRRRVRYRSVACPAGRSRRLHHRDQCGA